MKYLIALLLLGTAALLVAVVAKPATSTAEAPLSKYFGSREWYGDVLALEEFDRAVPIASRSAALVAVWAYPDGGRKRGVDVRLGVLHYLALAPPRVPWDQKLTSLLIEAGHSGNKDILHAALSVAHERRLSLLDAEFVAALDDSSETFQGIALMEITQWPDREKHLKAYIARHSKDAEHSRSIRDAQVLLEHGRANPEPRK